MMGRFGEMRAESVTAEMVNGFARGGELRLTLGAEFALLLLSWRRCLAVLAGGMTWCLRDGAICDENNPGSGDGGGGGDGGVGPFCIRFFRKPDLLKFSFFPEGGLSSPHPDQRTKG